MLARTTRPHTFTALIAAAVGLALGLSACAFKKDTEKPADPRMTVLQQQLDASRPILRSELKFDFVAGEALNIYSANVSWPVGRPILITATIGPKDIRTFDGRTEAGFYLPCERGSLKFHLRSSTPDGRVLSEYFVDPLCPTDLEVVGVNNNPKALETINGRLVLRNGALVSLKDQSLKLNVDQLIIDGTATIETFDSARTAEFSKGPHTQAPPISINAKKASGTLLLALNGIDGRDATPVLEITDASRNGAQGRASETETLVPSNMGRSAETSAATARARCTVPAGKGADGKDSPLAIGPAGLDGSPAIGTSEVRIEIADSRFLRMDIRLNPGNGGKGAQGSIVKGGNAGSAGVAIAPCKAASNGIAGKDSKRGADGRNGSNGSCGKIHINRELLARTRLEDINLRCSIYSELIQQL